MPLEHFIAHYLNLLLAGPVTYLMVLSGNPPADPSAPINGVFAMEIVSFLILLIFFILVRVTLKVEKPGTIQQLAEMLEEFVAGQAEPIIGAKYRRYLGLLVAILLFVLVNNLFGLVPDVDTPTASPVVPLGLAVLVFIYYHWQGLKANKHRYVKQFLGPVWWLAPFMFVIEIVSHCARVLSLTIRLFANMLASDLLILIFFSMFPLLVPLPFIGLHLAESLIQAYVFMLLAAIYVGQAIAHDHDVA